jgi:hypothetical protein
MATLTLTQKIKQVLDSANWTYETTHGTSYTDKDCEKACRFLERNKWSVNFIEDSMSDVDKDFIEDLKADGVSEEIAYAAAISDQIAHSRCDRYTWKNRFDSQNKWGIVEVTFLIVK